MSIVSIEKLVHYTIENPTDLGPLSNSQVSFLGTDRDHQNFESLFLINRLKDLGEFLKTKDDKVRKDFIRSTDLNEIDFGSRWTNFWIHYAPCICFDSWIAKKVEKVANGLLAKIEEYQVAQEQETLDALYKNEEDVESANRQFERFLQIIEPYRVNDLFNKTVVYDVTLIQQAYLYTKDSPEKAPNIRAFIDRFVLILRAIIVVMSNIARGNLSFKTGKEMQAEFPKLVAEAVDEIREEANSEILMRRASEVGQIDVQTSGDE